MAKNDRYIEFGAKLRQARHASGLKMAQVSAQVEVSADALYKYERGEMAFSFERASKFIAFIRQHLGDEEAQAAALLLVTGRENGPAPPQEEAGVAERLAEVQAEAGLTTEEVRVLRQLLERLEGTG